VDGWYRGLVLKYHPDRGGSHEAMVAINDAHERLVALVEQQK
jgi:curved DNA-binding protein CbpA